MVWAGTSHKLREDAGVHVGTSQFIESAPNSMFGVLLWSGALKHIGEEMPQMFWLFTIIKPGRRGTDVGHNFQYQTNVHLGTDRQQ